MNIYIIRWTQFDLNALLSTKLFISRWQNVVKWNSRRWCVFRVVVAWRSDGNAFIIIKMTVKWCDMIRNVVMYQLCDATESEQHAERMKGVFICFFLSSARSLFACALIVDGFLHPARWIKTPLWERTSSIAFDWYECVLNINKATKVFYTYLYTKMVIIGKRILLCDGKLHTKIVPRALWHLLLISTK